MFSAVSRDNRLVFCSLVFWGIGEGLWWYLLPIYIGDLGADPVEIGFVLSVSMVAVTVSYIPLGWVSDHVSRRKVMSLGWFAGMAAIVMVATAQTWQLVVPGLVLYFLSGAITPVLNAYVTAANSDGSQLRRVFTLVFSGFLIGTMLSPIVGGWLADMWGLRQVFCLAAIFFAISTVLILMIREQPVRSFTPSDGADSLHGNRVFVTLCVLFFLIHLSGHLGIPLSPKFLQEERGLTMSQIGILGSINGFGSALLTVVLGRWPRGRIAGLLLAQAAVAAYSVLMLTTTAFPFVSLALFLRGALGAARHLAGARLGELMPAASLGLGFGVFQTVVNVAFTISPYLAGWLYAADPYYPFVAALATAVPVMALTVLLGRQEPPAQQRGASG